MPLQLKKVVEEKPSSPTNFNLKNRSIENLESKLNSHKYKDLTDDKISERISKLTGQIDGKRKQIESKGRGAEKPTLKPLGKNIRN